MDTWKLQACRLVAGGKDPGPVAADMLQDDMYFGPLYNGRSSGSQFGNAYFCPCPINVDSISMVHTRVRGWILLLNWKTSEYKPITHLTQLSVGTLRRLIGQKPLS